MRSERMSGADAFGTLQPRAKRLIGHITNQKLAASAT